VVPGEGGGKGDETEITGYTPGTARETGPRWKRKQPSGPVLLHFHEVRMRKVTVTYSLQESGYVPMIRLRGKWLQLAGFEEGTPVQIEVAAGRMTLTVAERASSDSLR
jgi:Toxin SymE, type I toxin-antitoxin system